MHIPDNYLSPSTCAVLAAAMIPVWKMAASKVKEELSRKRMPILGVTAAFSFLIMMFNIPLPGGTTGHAVGGALAAILLGPYSAVISITIALAVQALFFGDGGILAFGANAFNMAFIMPVSAYGIFAGIKKLTGNKAEIFGAALAGYISVNMAALFTAFEFGIQPLLFRDGTGLPMYCPYGLNISIPAMMIPHLLIVGILEGIITAGVYGYLKKASPELIYNGQTKKINIFYILLMGAAFITPLGLLATGTAWGEWGSEEIKTMTGFVPKAMDNGFSFNAIFPDYSIKFLNEHIGYVISAFIGMAVIFITMKIWERLEAGKKKEK